MTDRFPRAVVLDPQRQPPDDAQRDRYTVITTERDLLETLGTDDRALWICGEFLCEWAKTWLRSWEYPEARMRDRQPPRQQLQQAIPYIEIPANWDDERCRTFLEVLDSRESHSDAIVDLVLDPVVALLSAVSDRDADFWQAEPSREHLAEWLTIELPETDRPLELFWQERRPQSELFEFYQVASTAEKRDRLRWWLGIADRDEHGDRALPATLSTFPLPIPETLRSEFRDYWNRQLHTSESACLDRLDPDTQPGFEEIAQLSLKLFEHQPHYITANRRQTLRAALNAEENSRLDELMPPDRPDVLPQDAEPEDALAWVTDRYLPYRRWETTHWVKSASEHRYSCELADSFVRWIYDRYPHLKAAPVAESHLNYRATHTAIELSREAPVLWVVVDGLGWLDHCKLIELLGDRELHPEADITPTFSILPTATKYAKWGLYAQQTPRGDRWADDIKAAFTSIGQGQHYTDRQTSQLERDLRAAKHSLYCWDTVKLDKLYHEVGNWEQIYTVDRKNELNRIADLIERFVGLHPHPESLRIVISSDHGQLFGECAARISPPDDLETCGRIAFGRTDDDRFLTLDRDTFDLPEDISVVRGEASCGSFSYSNGHETNGAHGGLFPEEVTIGFSCLRLHPIRSKPIVVISGKGEAGKPGQIDLEIHNPNSVTLRDVSWKLEPELAIDWPDRVSPGVTRLSLAIDAFPSLGADENGDTCKVSGAIQFRYDRGEPGRVAIDSSSKLAIEHLVQSTASDVFDF